MGGEGGRLDSHSVRPCQDLSNLLPTCYGVVAALRRGPVACIMLQQQGLSFSARTTDSRPPHGHGFEGVARRDVRQSKSKLQNEPGMSFAINETEKRGGAGGRQTPSLSHSHSCP